LVSGLLNDVANATIITLMVLLSMVLNVVQTYRSQQAAERLRDEVAPTAAVVRDGTWMDLPRRDLVPGDVIRLAAGDRVPADARLLTSRDLHVQQAALTGESMPTEKEQRSAKKLMQYSADGRYDRRQIQPRLGGDDHGIPLARRHRVYTPRIAR